jgi:hypothetical protein
MQASSTVFLSIFIKYKREENNVYRLSMPPLKFFKRKKLKIHKLIFHFLYKMIHCKCTLVQAQNEKKVQEHLFFTTVFITSLDQKLKKIIHTREK